MASSLLSGITTDTTTLVIFLLVFLVAWYWLTTITSLKLPPGPPALPIVGNMFSVMAASSDILGQMTKWHKEYGDIFRLKLGNKYMIVVNSYKLAHETLVKNADTFSARPTHLYIMHKAIELTGSGVIQSDGPVWKTLRRMSLKTLRDFGVGKKSLEERVHEEARAVVQVIDQSEGRPMEVKDLFPKLTSNVICSVIFGNRFDYEDPFFNQLTALVNRALAQPTLFFPGNYLPLIRFLPQVKKVLRGSVDSIEDIDRHIGTILKEHEESYDPEVVRDFVDLYIKTRSEDGQDTNIYSAANMRRVILDLFVAGTETTATTLHWIVLYLVTHPHVQRRCQQVVDKMVGQHRQVTMEDKKQMPYIEAVIIETLRVCPIVPLSVPHCALKQGSIAGYDVPAQSVVIPNIKEIHMDPRTWTDPEVFRPERFLDKGGNFCPPRENFMPFSIGPRTCLGETLARMEVFVLFITLLQNFTFSMGRGQQPNLQGHMGVTYSAKPQPVMFTRR